MFIYNATFDTKELMTLDLALRLCRDTYPSESMLCQQILEHLTQLKPQLLCQENAEKKPVPSDQSAYQGAVTASNLPR